MNKQTQKITPFLWFDNQAEEAAKFYTSIFKNSKVGKVSRYDKAGEKVAGRPAGSVMTVEFQLEGQDFVALNGGPLFKFTEAVSFVVSCRTQAEVDKFWKKLSAGGKEVQCGWLKDKYGLSWQIVPTILGELLSSKDAAKSHRVMEAMLKMVKLDVKKLQRAAKGETGGGQRRTLMPANGQPGRIASAKGKPQTVDDYLARATPDQRAALEKIRRTIHAVAPEVEENISYGLAGFKLEGRALVYFGAWASHCAFYPASSALVKTFADELKPFETSKGTIRFSADKPLPTSLVRAMVRARITENAQKARAKAGSGHRRRRSLSVEKLSIKSVSRPRVGQHQIRGEKA